MGTLVNASYRLGISIVLVTIAISAVLCLAFSDGRTTMTPAAEDLTDLGFTLGRFELIERSGKTINETDLEDRVWISAFVFSRCTTSCPVISKTMKDIQLELSNTEVLLVSLSVDPDHDTPAVLREFADRYAANPERWWYLTGSKGTIYELILDRFKISVDQGESIDPKEKAEAVAHSDRLVLVGPGNKIMGMFDSKDPKAVRRLEDLARLLDRKLRAGRSGWILRLPSVNASFNASCTVLLALGWLLIRAGRPRAHSLCMVIALSVSGLFLSSYLVYHYHMGSVRFRGVGGARLTYLTILLSHTLLAIAVVPLIAVTVTRAVRGRYSDHSRIARVTYPIWLYVSMTGVVVYWMLYHWPAGNMHYL